MISKPVYDFYVLKRVQRNEGIFYSLESEFLLNCRKNIFLLIISNRYITFLKLLYYFITIFVLRIRYVLLFNSKRFNFVFLVTKIFNANVCNLIII